MTDLSWDYNQFIYSIRLIAVVMGAGVSAMLLATSRARWAFQSRGNHSIFFGILVYTLSVTIVTSTIVAAREPSPGSLIYIAYIISFGFLYRGIILRYEEACKRGKELPEEIGI